MPTTDRNRFYSSKPGINNVGINYGWSDNAIITGNSQPTTGAWVPIIANASGAMQVASQPSTATYQNVMVGLTGSSFDIPAGVYNWSIVVQSGTALIDGVPLLSPATLTMPGVGFGGKSSDLVNVAVTGRVLVSYTL